MKETNDFRDEYKDYILPCIIIASFLFVIVATIYESKTTILMTLIASFTVITSQLAIISLVASKRDKDATIDQYKQLINRMNEEESDLQD